jgi:hypothetical protein
MTYYEAYLILIHALAFLGLSLAGAIARHIWLTWDRHKPASEADGTELANTTIYAPPSYGVRVKP